MLYEKEAHSSHLSNQRVEQPMVQRVWLVGWGLLKIMGWKTEMNGPRGGSWACAGIWKIRLYWSCVFTLLTQVANLMCWKEIWVSVRTLEFQQGSHTNSVTLRKFLYYSTMWLPTVPFCPKSRYSLYRMCLTWNEYAIIKDTQALSIKIQL